MARIGLHASHEEIDPARMLAAVQYADSVGFELAMCSDHISPWSSRQAHAGFAWSWLGAAMATTNLEFGVVSPAGYRYPPAVLAHAIATLEFMYPGRLWCAVGSGEHLNEKVAGKGWPAKQERQRILAESFDIIRRLHEGEDVTHDGAISVDGAKIWDLPSERPPLILPALTPETAAELASVADGLITVNQPIAGLTEIFQAYRESGGAGEVMLQVHLSYAPTEQQARNLAWEQWRTNVFDPRVMSELATVEEFDRRSEQVSLDELAESVVISSDINEHIDTLKEYEAIGFDRIYLHNVGQFQRDFIDAFARHVLPKFR